MSLLMITTGFSTSDLPDARLTCRAAIKAVGNDEIKLWEINKKKEGLKVEQQFYRDKPKEEQSLFIRDLQDHLWVGRQRSFLFTMQKSV